MNRTFLDRLSARAPLLSVALVAAGLPSLSSCRKEKADTEPPPVIVIDAAADKVPPVDPSIIGLTIIDAAAPGELDNKTPFEQAQIYYGQGEYWKARLLVETPALAAGAPKDETELLVKICLAQDDPACIDKCAKKLGRKIKMLDGGVPAARVGPDDLPQAARMDVQPDPELGVVRELVLKKKYPEARKRLEPRVLAGTASTEETRLLRIACSAQNDKMCVALCDAKMK
ncbi:MAG: hypothetical protein JWP97_5062 [Labilithrix sp.]|nr:hypothetical protein [Labilithrix sp.]